MQGKWLLYLMAFNVGWTSTQISVLPCGNSHAAIV